VDKLLSSFFIIPLSTIIPRIAFKEKANTARTTTLQEWNGLNEAKSNHEQFSLLRGEKAARLGRLSRIHT
jgi:hypothetical protein